MDLRCKEASGRGVVDVCDKRKEIQLERSRLLHKQGIFLITDRVRFSAGVTERLSEEGDIKYSLI